jgi:phage terminase large subunit-like protein
MNKLSICYKFEPLFELLEGKYPKVDTVVMTGGRYSLKSYTVAIWSLISLIKHQYSVLYTRYTNLSIIDSVKPEVSEKIDLLGVGGEVDDTNTHISFGDNRIAFKGIKAGSKRQTASLKSLSGFNAFIVDEAEEIPDYETYEKVYLSIRETEKRNITILILNPTVPEHWIHKKFFEEMNVADGSNTIKDNVMFIHTSYLDADKDQMPPNILNYYNKLREKDPLKYENIVMGGWIPNIDGALWTPDLIEKTRTIPFLKRVIVAIDPPATKAGDEAGIITQGIGEDDKVYILSDKSGNYSPKEWGTVAANEAKIHDADAYVVETNQGGDMVESVLRHYDKTTRIIRIHAKKGKHLRAEPVVSTYEQKKVLHSYGLERLENEMLTWIPGEGESPNRVDAMVYGVTELTGNKTNTNVWI